VSRRPSSLSDEARVGLLARVQARQTAKAAEPKEAPKPPPAPNKKATDFTTLPGFDELRLQRTVAELTGIGSPFFRMHDARAGAETRIDGKTYLNFSSYDYLGLNGHPEVAAAAKEAIDRYGVSCSASRLVAGERPIHRALEHAIADHYGVEDCVAMVSGHATNVGVIGHLLGAKDLFVTDSVAHNSVMLGGALARAERRSFPHNDLAALEALLSSTRHRHERCLIVVEGHYSMDGDVPDLPALIALKNRYDAWLMVDEAHGIGVLGPTGRGVHEHFGVDAREVDIWMGTLSKTLSGAGGYIAGSAALVEYLKCTAGSFVFSVGIPPAVAAAATKAIEIMHREPERVTRLHHNGRFFLDTARELGLDTGTGIGSAIAPVMVGDSLMAVMLAQKLFTRGINVLPIIYPAVPAKASRLRFFLTADHTEEQIRSALEATAEELPKLDAAKAMLAKALNLPLDLQN
jgi:8-amino-7-oxononanoate synthase